MDIHFLINGISVAIGIMASAIIIWGVLVVVFKFLKIEFSKGRGDTFMENRNAIRRELGCYLLLGLEVLIAADVLETIANPVLSEVAILASIVFIRTFIGYFLEKEMGND